MEPFIDLRSPTPHSGRLECVWVPGADGRLECRWVPDREPDAEVNLRSQKAKPVRKAKSLRKAKSVRRAS